MAREYEELCVAAGFRSDIAPTIAFDLLIGSQINHILATGRPPTPEVTDQITQVILAGLRATRVDPPSLSAPHAVDTRLSSSNRDGK